MLSYCPVLPLSDVMPFEGINHLCVRQTPWLRATSRMNDDATKKRKVCVQALYLHSQMREKQLFLMTKHPYPLLIILFINGRTRPQAYLLNPSWRVQCEVKISLAVAHVFIRRHPAPSLLPDSASITSERIAEYNLEPIFGWLVDG